MSDIERKDAAIGLLIIGLVAMAGWVGFLYINPITKTKTEEDETTIYVYSIKEVPITYESGLPDDWSTAPNASSITLYNETGDAITITLGQILEYVKKWEETNEAVDPGKKDWWEKRLEPITVNNPSEIPITGVNILDLLRVFDCNFAGELEFTSFNDTASKLTMDVVELGNIIDNDAPVILALAANKQWLKQSIIGDKCGNFSIFSWNTLEDEEIEFTCYDMKDIRVTKNWTIDVNVFNADGSKNSSLTLDAFNITKAYNAPVHYEYKNTAWWYFNATYRGTNISQIVNYTVAKGKDYLLNITLSPGDSQPTNTKWRRGIFSYSDYFNRTDVEGQFSNNGTNLTGNHVDYVNWTDDTDKNTLKATGTPMLYSNLKMCITNDIQYLYSNCIVPGKEGYNDPWTNYYNDGYPPFKLIIPGLGQSRYFNGVIEINIKLV